MCDPPGLGRGIANTECRSIASWGVVTQLIWGPIGFGSGLDQTSRVLLQDGNELVSPHVTGILRPFGFRELALSRFLRQLVNPRLQLRICRLEAFSQLSEVPDSGIQTRAGAPAAM